MNRSFLSAAVVAATAALCVSTLSPVAQAAPASPHGQSHAHATASVRAEKASSKVQDKIERIEAALVRASKAADRRLSVEAAAEVNANIEADQQALAALTLRGESASTLGQVREVTARASQYRASLYAQAIATLVAIEDLSDKVSESRASLSLTIDFSAQSDLDSAEESLQLATAGAVALDSRSDRADLRAVRTDLSTAAQAYANAQR